MKREKEEIDKKNEKVGNSVLLCERDGTKFTRTLAKIIDDCHLNLSNVSILNLKIGMQMEKENPVSELQFS